MVEAFKKYSTSPILLLVISKIAVSICIFSIYYIVKRGKNIKYIVNCIYIGKGAFLLH